MVLDWPTEPCWTESLSCVRLSVTPWTVARQTPLFVGILQARILEWVAMPSSRVSSQPRDRTQVSQIAGNSLMTKPPQNPRLTYYPFLIWLTFHMFMTYLCSFIHSSICGSGITPVGKQKWTKAESCPKETDNLVWERVIQIHLCDEMWYTS